MDEGLVQILPMNPFCRQLWSPQPCLTGFNHCRFLIPPPDIKLFTGRPRCLSERILRMLEIDFSMPQLPPPPPHNPCLASPRPCPGYVQNKPAGKSKIQLNKSKIQLKKSDLIEQIKNLYRANPKQHLNKSKISVGQIPKLL